MSRSARVLLAASLLFGGTAAAQTKAPVPTPKKSEPKKTAPVASAPAAKDYSGRKLFIGSLQLGYNAGIALHAALTFDNLAQGLPFALRLGYGHTWSDPGDPLAARRVFIDNNTNGEPQSSGDNWDLRFDLMYPVKIASLQRSKLFGGMRYNDFTASFAYVGGNETFDVNGNQWGVGGGLETAFALSPIVDMTFSVGADYFFKSGLDGHDSYYYPDGSGDNTIANYTYKDADEAINQPDFNARVLMGVAYRF
jgi:hypothetical protein